jgi:hypothetical protein
LWVNNRELKGKKKLLDFGEAGMSVDVPKQVAQTPLAVRNVFLPFTRSITRGAVADAHNAGSAQQHARELVLGGVYVLDVLAVPPPPKKVKVRPTVLQGRTTGGWDELRCVVYGVRCGTAGVGAPARDVAGE